MEEEVAYLIKEVARESERGFLLPLGNRKMHGVRKVHHAALCLDFLPNKSFAKFWDMPAPEKEDGKIRLPVVYCHEPKTKSPGPTFCVFKHRFGPFFTVTFLHHDPGTTTAVLMENEEATLWKVICMQDPQAKHNFYACDASCTTSHETFRNRLRSFCRAWLHRHHQIPLFCLSPTITPAAEKRLTSFPKLELDSTQTSVFYIQAF